PMDPWQSENQRITDQCLYMGCTLATASAVQKAYALGVRANIGYNYAFFSPWVYRASTDRYVGSGSVNETEVAQTANTLMWGTSIWDRVANGGPTGGGNWVIETPCWLDESGNLLSPMSKFGADLWSYGTGWATTNNWLIYGGLWPFYNQTAVPGLPGLVDGHVIIGYADTHVKAKSIKSITEGCSTYGVGVRRGTRTDKDKFIWDLE
ncbi:MAG: hypothetical protein J0H02_06240, partial [Armatimonadetes bacterium]|nr:hypothetical protein [Armatimonadota bacterium]